MISMGTARTTVFDPDGPTIDSSGLAARGREGEGQGLEAGGVNRVQVPDGQQRHQPPAADSLDRPLGGHHPGPGLGPAPSPSR
jgi:hypothetical protein